MTSDDLVERVLGELDDIEVMDGKCRWVDVANAQTTMRLELRTALADFASGIRASLQMQALPDDKRASEDGRRAAIEECAQIADYQAKIPNNTEIQRAHIYSATCIAKAIRALASREPRPAGGGEDGASK